MEQRMSQRALVLGGGGSVGIAWEVGLAAGLAEEGIDLRLADKIVGTSAGSFVGAELAAGRAPSDMIARLREGARARAGEDSAEPPNPVPVPNLQKLMEFMARSPKTEAEALALRTGASSYSTRRAARRSVAVSRRAARCRASFHRSR
jgi:NTE family protein